VAQTNLLCHTVLLMNTIRSQVPTLIVAGNPRDDTVIMMPDFYSLLALLLGTNLQFLIPRPLMHIAAGETLLNGTHPLRGIHACRL